MLRVKYLSELIKKKKQNEGDMKNSEQTTDEPSEVEDQR